jgi:2-polyprenyl-3-methyl-5-hydroxy-6-metoxy-1,4-benzoquinol methylase
MQEIFENYIENSFDGLFQANFKLRQFELNYKKYFYKKVTLRVLDIGVGRGEMLSCMKNWGHYYHGIDISPSTVEFCKKLDLSCELVDDTEFWLKNHQNQFDIITCLDVLEHIPKERLIQFVEAIRNSLIKDGLAIFQVPNLQSPFGYLHHFNDITHISGFVEHSLNQVLLSARFNKMSYYGFEELYEKTPKIILKKILRYFYRKIIRFLRTINANPNPKILDPVFFAVVYREY